MSQRWCQPIWKPVDGLLVLYPGETNLWTDHHARNQIGKNQRLLKKLGKEREGSRYDEYEPYVGEKAMLIHCKINIYCKADKKREGGKMRKHFAQGRFWAKSADRGIRVRLVGLGVAVSFTLVNEF